MFADLWRDRMGPTSRRHRPKYSLLIISLVLVIIGVAVQFVMSPTLANILGPDIPDSYFFVRHLAAVCLGLVALLIGFKVKLATLLRAGPWLLVGSLILALITVIIGGLNSRWLQFGPFSFQAVEVLKIGFILTAAGYFQQLRQVKASTKRQASPRSIKSLFTTITPLRPLLVIVGLSIFIIAILQADFGSLFIVLAIFITMVWLTDFPVKQFAILIMVLISLATLLVVSTPYRRQRVTTLLHPTADCQDSGYQVCQALIGIGSGGLLGRGIGQSVQIHGYLPEVKNDSVFAYYAEIIGFVGSLVLLLLFYALFRSIHKIALHSDPTMMLIGVGILTWLGVQTVINIGAMLALLPLKGITLPYLSYGGSSILLVMFATGIIFQISAYTTYGPSSTTSTKLDDRHRTNRQRVRGEARTTLGNPA